MPAKPLTVVPSLLALLLAAAPAVAGPPATPPEASDAVTHTGDIFPYPWHEKTLANGLRVLVIPTPSEGLVSYRTVVRTGARDEFEKGVTGFAHFFEHMMFRGTEKYPAEKYNEIVTRMGADSNAYTSADMTVYEFDISKDDLETVAEIESDRFMNLAYSKPGFETEAGAVYGEYRKNRSSPFFVLYEALRAEAFSRHTYAHTTMGFVEDIKAMPKQYDYSRTFFNRYYRPDNCVIIVTGDVEPEPTFALIQQHYGAWEPGYVAPKIKAEPVQKKSRRVEVEYEGRTLPRVWIAYKGGAFAPEDKIWVASLVLAELAFGQTSDIYRELQLEQQRVESLVAGAATNRDPELWSVLATIKDEADIDPVIARIDQTVAHYRDQLPDQAKLDAVKSYMRYDYLLGLDTPSAVAGEVARFIGTAGDLGQVEVLYRNLHAVTPEDVREAARRWLVEQRRTVAILRESKSPPAGDAAKGAN
ncbi:Protease, insulinase family/protease, insulinase family protein [Enhygromyxa salina]|uniref:Protease, insulinase family/protease, insulinase family protein n=1 Tax=Enhygromyxa salina TaxID=215803 RepID=A0A0C2DC22_9BACT|nr:pitrilysin family protein [Enhygromyxa salina]KIG19010.1 Protease, insulinase family/protease, insulinase family protein [Enhygromyxa salina]